MIRTFILSAALFSTVACVEPVDIDGTSPCVQSDLDCDGASEANGEDLVVLLPNGSVSGVNVDAAGFVASGVLSEGAQDMTSIYEVMNLRDDGPETFSMARMPMGSVDYLVADLSGLEGPACLQVRSDECDGGMWDASCYVNLRDDYLSGDELVGRVENTDFFGVGVYRDRYGIQPYPSACENLHVL